MNLGLDANGVSVELGGRAVLDAVDLRVEPHELVGLVGRTDPASPRCCAPCTAR